MSETPTDVDVVVRASPFSEYDAVRVRVYRHLTHAVLCLIAYTPGGKEKYYAYLQRDAAKALAECLLAAFPERAESPAKP